jgi:hypothetical protein
MDEHSVGNRMADYQANLSRLKSDRTYPLGLQQLPLARCEHHLLVKSSDGLVIIDDLRRTGKLLLKSRTLAKWTAKSDLVTERLLPILGHPLNPVSCSSFTILSRRLVSSS